MILDLSSLLGLLYPHPPDAVIEIGLALDACLSVLGIIYLSTAQTEWRNFADGFPDKLVPSRFLAFGGTVILV